MWWIRATDLRSSHMADQMTGSSHNLAEPGIFNIKTTQLPMNSSPLPASAVSMRTRNPIRAIVDSLNIAPHPDKPLISLALGDPTTHGNFLPAPQCVAAVAQELQSNMANGYVPAFGVETARLALAQRYSIPAHRQLSSKDVVIASGCSDAINLCISALANEGENILLPQPGFALYETLCSSRGIECRFYPLIPERGWEADLQIMESLINQSTRCILINNPSNPCGSVYSREHLTGIISIARRYGLPILSDEIYADMAFKGHDFYPLASLADDVPMLVVGGLAKRYLVPGWRIGWVLIYNDQQDRLRHVHRGIINLSQMIMGGNSIVQRAIPAILEQTPQSFYDETLVKLEFNADLCFNLLLSVPGIVICQPQGAMYMMVQILLNHFPDISSEIDFVEKLVGEESVLCLPGSCFRCPVPFIRIVITLPPEKLEIACERIRNFCGRHFKP